jgi:hypothetical protein
MHENGDVKVDFTLPKATVDKILEQRKINPGLTAAEIAAIKVAVVHNDDILLVGLIDQIIARYNNI